MSGSSGYSGEREALGPQLLDRRLELRDRRRDVRQLDHVGLGPVHQLTELGEVVTHLLIGGERLGERRQDPAGERDVTQLDLHAGDVGEGVDDGQQ